jgi:beta-glucosidase-like glycosyl hydrolase
MVKRILAAWYKVGQDSGYPTASFNSWKIGNYNVGGNHKDNVRKMARDGIVLLKNTNNTLPLKKPKSIAVIGSDSIVAPKGANAWYTEDPPLQIGTQTDRATASIEDATTGLSPWGGEAEL